jgi:hypothetical protein
MNLVDLFWHIALGQARKCRLWLVLASVEKPLIQGRIPRIFAGKCKNQTKLRKEALAESFRAFSAPFDRVGGRAAQFVTQNGVLVRSLVQLMHHFGA